MRRCGVDAVAPGSGALMLPFSRLTIGEKSATVLRLAIRAVAAQLPCYHRIQELPGIGRILALTISMETGPIARFREDGRIRENH
jgi:transposase